MRLITGYLIDYLSLAVIALHNGGVDSVIHNNPDIHSGKGQPDSACQKNKQ